MERNALLITLKIKGYAKPDVLLPALGLSEQDGEAMLAQLTEEQLVGPTKLGLKLTAEGQKAAHTAMVAERNQVPTPMMHSLYEQFDTVNQRFKALIVSWQMRLVDGKSVPNDHSDTAHDQALLAELETINSEVVHIVDELSFSLPRFVRYSARFKKALRRLHNGELRYMAAPLIDSYHTIWFELHEDLIFLANTTRADEAAQGRAV